jgi:hypothetical protein
MRQGVTLDPAVAAVLGDGAQRAKRRRMTERQRKEAERQGQRQRVTLELNPALVRLVQAAARVEGCSPATVVNICLADALRRVAMGELVLSDSMRGSRSARYECVTELHGVEMLERVMGRWLRMVGEVREAMDGTLVQQARGWDGGTEGRAE